MQTINVTTVSAIATSATVVQAMIPEDLLSGDIGVDGGRREPYDGAVFRAACKTVRVDGRVCACAENHGGPDVYAGTSLNK